MNSLSIPAIEDSDGRMDDNEDEDADEVDECTSSRWWI